MPLPSTPPAPSRVSPPPSPNLPLLSPNPAPSASAPALAHSDGGLAPVVSNARRSLAHAAGAVAKRIMSANPPASPSAEDSDSAKAVAAPRRSSAALTAKRPRQVKPVPAHVTRIAHVNTTGAAVDDKAGAAKPLRKTAGKAPRSEFSDAATASRAVGGGAGNSAKDTGRGRDGTGSKSTLEPPVSSAMQRGAPCGSPSVGQDDISAVASGVGARASNTAVRNSSTEEKTASKEERSPTAERETADNDLSGDASKSEAKSEEEPKKVPAPETSSPDQDAGRPANLPECGKDRRAPKNRPPSIGLDAMKLADSGPQLVARRGPGRPPKRNLHQSTGGHDINPSSASSGSSSHTERPDPVLSRPSSSRRRMSGSSDESESERGDSASDGSDGDDDDDSSDSSHALPPPPPRSKPRKRPSANGIVRRHARKRPGSAQRIGEQASLPVRLMSSSTAALIVGKKGATFEDALATLGKTENAPRRPGRPSKVALQERRRALDLKKQLQREMQALEAKRTRQGRPKAGGRNTSPAKLSDSDSSEGSDGSCGSRDEEPDSFDTAKRAQGTPWVAGRTRAGSQGGKRYPGPARLRFVSGKEEDGSSSDESTRDGNAGQEFNRIDGPDEGQARPTRAKGALRRDGRKKSKVGRPRKSATALQTNGKVVPSAPSQRGKTVPLSEAMRKRKERTCTANKEELSEPVVKRRRGRPPSAGKPGSGTKGGNQTSFGEVAKSKGISPSSSGQGKGPREKTRPNEKDDGSRSSEDNSRPQASPSASNPRKRKRVRGGQRTTSSAAGFETCSCGGLNAEDSAALSEALYEKDQIIVNLRQEMASLRQEVEQTKEKLEKECSRALELEEALGLDIKMDTPSAAEYDKLAAKLVERERELTEREREQGEQDFQLQEKDAAMRGFMMQIKTLQAELEEARREGPVQGRSNVEMTDGELQANISRIMELEAIVDEKKERIEKLEKVVDSHAVVLKKSIKANRTLQQKIYSIGKL